MNQFSELLFVVVKFILIQVWFDMVFAAPICDRDILLPMCSFLEENYLYFWQVPPKKDFNLAGKKSKDELQEIREDVPTVSLQSYTPTFPPTYPTFISTFISPKEYLPI